MPIIKTYRGRFVSYGLGIFNYNDPGHTSDWGNHSIDYMGVGLVQIKDSKQQNVGPLFEGIYTLIKGYAWTFYEYLGAEQVLLLGDFIFVARSNGPYTMDGYHDGYLVLGNDTVERQNSSYADPSVIHPVSYGFRPPVDTKQKINLSPEHLSPCFNGPIPEDAVFQEWTEQEHTAFLEKFPKLYTCGGAVRLKRGKEVRWIFPHPDGTKAAWDHLNNTTLEDDWRQLQTMMDDALPIERERVLKSFQAKTDEV